MKPEGTREWCASIIEIAVVILALYKAPLVVLVPIVMYDIARSRNYIAFTISLMAIINAYIDAFSGNAIPNDDSTGAVLVTYVLIISALSAFLSIKSERILVLQKDYKRLRDDEEEQSSKLRLQNNELMNARDTEVYNAQLSERNRIAREIHDNVGHTLSRAILQMGALLAIHKEEPIHSELEGVRVTLDTAMNNIRSSVHDLHDDSIDVKSSIKQISDSLGDRFNLTLDIDIGDDMPRPVKYACIGITKECVSNIIKHSKNTDVDIKLNEHPSMYQLVVHDYSPDLEKDISSENKKDSGSAGMGLENIRARAESVNGTLSITTENGFRVFVSIPKSG